MSKLVFTVGFAFLLTTSMAGCGDDPAGDGNGDGSVDGVDADPNAPDSGPATDAYVPPGCTPGDTECSDCIDNDMDGRIDQFDPECTKAADDDEGSFATGIPGDNEDPVIQDCYFDGDSGQGNDPCELHTCCILDECPPELQGSYDPNDCEIDPACADQCLGGTTVGCDCFGCCTICVDGECHTVFTHPTVAPDCTDEVLDDPEKCPPCTLADTCSNPCDEDPCTLCPGQDPSELPEECEEQTCPDTQTPCQIDEDCASGEYCASGCCVEDIVVN